MLSFWPGPGVNLLAGAGAGVFPPANAYFWPGPGRAGGRDFGRGRDRGRGPGRPLKFIHKLMDHCHSYHSWDNAEIMLL